MNSDIELMLEKYQTYNLDWMGDEIKDIRLLTKHHIVKIENEDGSKSGIKYTLNTDNELLSENVKLEE